MCTRICLLQNNNNDVGEMNLVILRISKVVGTKQFREMYLLVQIWEGSSDPRGLLKGDVKRKRRHITCSNCWVYMFLILYKEVFYISLNNKLVPFIKGKLGEYRGLFRSDRSAMDQIFFHPREDEGIQPDSLYDLRRF